MTIKLLLKISLFTILCYFWLILSFCHAYEIKHNPDRAPSIEVNYHHLESNGDYVLDGLKFSDKDGEIINGFNADLRLPVSDYLTFHLGGQYIDRRFATYDFLDVKRWNSTTTGMIMGLKVYFP